MRRHDPRSNAGTAMVAITVGLLALPVPADAAPGSIRVGPFAAASAVAVPAVLPVQQVVTVTAATGGVEERRAAARRSDGVTHLRRRAGPDLDPAGARAVAPALRGGHLLRVREPGPQASPAGARHRGGGDAAVQPHPHPPRRPDPGAGAGPTRRGARDLRRPAGRGRRPGGLLPCPRWALVTAGAPARRRSGHAAAGLVDRPAGLGAARAAADPRPPWNGTCVRAR